MDFFENVKQAPPDLIFGLNTAFSADKRNSKVNLGAGVYKTADLKPLILKAVKQAEAQLYTSEISKDYLPIDGDPGYVEAAKQLVFGGPSERIYGAQTVGGTAALRVGSAFMHLHGCKRIFISDPTWANHNRIFADAGLEVETYPYYDAKARCFHFEAFYESLNHMPEGSLVLLQGCCHNPTGFDPSVEQWKALCERLESRRLFPFFDFAYQGFGGDPEKDAAAVRLFVEAGLQCTVAVSHSKNFGLYAERTGALYIVCASEGEAKRVGSRLKMVIRGLYSNPPCHGARLVARILGDEQLKKMWRDELRSMYERINEMRSTLVSLLATQTDRFDCLATQLGMFSYTGLNADAVERLIADYGIYLPPDGRINVAGLNQQNVSYVAEAILAVTSYA